MLPGAFFILWSLWWFVNVSCIYIHRTQRKNAFAAQAHYRLPLLPEVQLEPIGKVVLPLIGIAGELYLSHHLRWRCALRASRFVASAPGCTAMLHLLNWCTSVACNVLRWLAGCPTLELNFALRPVLPRAMHNHNCAQPSQLPKEHLCHQSLPGALQCTAANICLCRTLYQNDDTFWSAHLNNWQHTVMFAAFAVSGIVDLIGQRTELPGGTEHVRLTWLFARHKFWPS